jgi:uncharacterized protein YdaU (DUF1376 family)
MTDLPFMPMWWADFFGDPKVAELPLDTQGVYALLLGRMWMNGGWLKDDVGVIARQLGRDPRTLRPHFDRVSALFQRRNDAVVGAVLTQKRLTIELSKAAETIAKNKARTAAATAKRLGKSTKAADVTYSPTDQRNVARDEPRNDQRSVERNERTPARGIRARAEPSSDGSDTPPTPSAPDDARADLGYRPAASSRGLEGRSPAVASAAHVRRNDWDQTPTPGPIGDTAFLRAYREAGGDLTRLPQTQGVPMREHQPEEDDHDERQQQQPDQQPALAARRGGDDDEPLDLGF